MEKTWVMKKPVSQAAERSDALNARAARLQAEAIDWPENMSKPVLEVAAVSNLQSQISNPAPSPKFTACVHEVFVLREDGIIKGYIIPNPIPRAKIDHIYNLGNGRWKADIRLARSWKMWGVITDEETATEWRLKDTHMPITETEWI